MLYPTSRTRLPLILGIAFLVAITTPNPAQAKEVLIASINHETPRLIISNSIMSQIYQRLGHSMTIVNFPPKRSLLEVNNGSANGELARARIIEADYPNLVRIPFSIGTIKLVAIQQKGHSQIHKISDLKDLSVGSGTELRVGVLRGFVTTEKISQKLTREIYNSLSGLFKALLNDRIDVVLFTKLDVEHYIRQLKLQDQVVVSEPLLEIPIYHYLHKRSEKTAQALTKEMQKMQTSGELQKLIDTHEQSFIEGKK